jgi:hypothetical protein
MSHQITGRGVPSSRMWKRRAAVVQRAGKVQELVGTRCDQGAMGQCSAPRLGNSQRPGAHRQSGRPDSNKHPPRRRPHACVVRELSPERSMASAGLRANANGTGASRISEPLPADIGSVAPQYGARVCSTCRRAARTVVPMSKQRPLLLKCHPGSCPVASAGVRSQGGCVMPAWLYPRARQEVV